MMARKTMVSACMVNSWLKTPELIRSASADASCMRIRKASEPPRRKKRMADTP